MKRILTLATVAFAAALWATPAHAVPSAFTYSGFLLDAGGDPVTTVTTVTFAFFDTAGANTTSPSYVEPPVTVAPSKEGYFTAIVGTTVPPSFFRGNVWLTLRVGNEQYMLPRVRLTAAPAAIALPFVASGSGANLGTALTATDTYVYGSSAVTLPGGGVCVVSASAMITNFGAANTTEGPFFRIAVKRGGVDGNDGLYGLYPGALPANEYANLSRTRTVGVTPGEATQFGCYFGFPSGDWVGDAAHCVVDYHCF